MFVFAYEMRCGENVTGGWFVDNDDGSVGMLLSLCIFMYLWFTLPLSCLSFSVERTILVVYDILPLLFCATLTTLTMCTTQACAGISDKSIELHWQSKKKTTAPQNKMQKYIYNEQNYTHTHRWQQLECPFTARKTHNSKHTEKRHKHETNIVTGIDYKHCLTVELKIKNLLI